MHLLSETFEALNKEAQFTKEMLASGATQIRNANYASKGIYFQAFTGLATGLERIGKLCLMLDHYIDHNGEFPDSIYMQREIGHNLVVIYEKSTSIIAKHSISMRFLQSLNDPIHQAILSILSEFALGDRYANIDLLIGGKPRKDPIASWFNQVDKPLYESRISDKKKEGIRKNAATIGFVLSQHVRVLHTSEIGEEITDLEDASRMTGMYEVVAPYRQLCVVQVIRYWVELLSSLQHCAMRGERQDIPFFTEIFAAFYNEDSYIRTRKTPRYRRVDEDQFASGASHQLVCEIRIILDVYFSARVPYRKGAGIYHHSTFWVFENVRVLVEGSLIGEAQKKIPHAQLGTHTLRPWVTNACEVDAHCCPPTETGHSICRRRSWLRGLHECK